MPPPALYFLSLLNLYNEANKFAINVNKSFQLLTTSVTNNIE